MNHVPVNLFCASCKHLHRWWLNRFHGQPVPVLYKPFCKDIFPNIQSGCNINGRNVNPGGGGNGRHKSELLTEQVLVASSTNQPQHSSSTKSLKIHSMKHSSLNSLVFCTTIRGKKYHRKFSNVFSNYEMQILLWRWMKIKSKSL